MADVVAYVGVGANLGDPVEQCRRAMNALDRAPSCAIICASSLYWTAPVGYAEQPWFANAVIAVRTALTPARLWSLCAEIERRLGRERTIVDGPRTIDLDILLFGDLVMNTPALTIPHPRIERRRFVLAPLVEINPAGRHPVSGRPFVDSLAALPGDQDVVIGAPPSSWGIG